MLIISQTFVPDTPAVGQYMADVARGMAQRGWRVVVLASARAYDDPSIKFPPRESRNGVDVIRLPLSSFGKRTIAIRLLGAMLFLLQVLVRGLFTQRLRGIVVSTSPPMCPLVALMIAALRRVPVTYWAMDINPDQAVALVWLRDGSTGVRLFRWMNCRVLRRAACVVTLDDAMASRLLAKVPGSDLQHRLHIIEPWPLVDDALPDDEAVAMLRAERGWGDDFVLMYSGNVSIASPVTTFLEAAKQLRNERGIRFVFVGGGLGMREVTGFAEQHALLNIQTMPYQPLDRLAVSLATADVQLVTLGDAMVGMIHPCKIYGCMAVGRPVLMVGPSDSPHGRLIASSAIGWALRTGDVDGVVAAVRDAMADRQHTAQRGAAARQVLAERFDAATLRGRFMDLVEATMRR